MNFIKLVAKFVIIFSLIVWTIIGVVFISNKFVKGDYSISKSISDIADKYIKKEPVNGLVLGTDKSGALTDTILFVNYNPNTYKINIISIPRDTLIRGNHNRKINSLYGTGKEKLVIENVEKILNTKINYFTLVNLNGFREIVDSIGGVSINVPQNMKYYDPVQNLNINISKGQQVLNGAKAEGFVRYRSGYSNGDLGRIKAQQLFIDAAVTQMLKPQNITKIPSLINIVLKNAKTNMTKSEMVTYIDDAAKIKKENISMTQLPGEPQYIGGVSYFIHDSAKIKSLMDSINYDESEEDLSDTSDTNVKYNIEVLNGTNMSGLALEVATQLRQAGFNIDNVGNSDQFVSQTKIIERNDRKGGKRIKKVLKTGEVIQDFDEDSDVDITIIVGDDLSKND